MEAGLPPLASGAPVNCAAAEPGTLRTTPGGPGGAMAAAAAGGSVEMGAVGASTSWESNQSNQVRLGNELLKWIAGTDSVLSAKWGSDWNAIPEEWAAGRELYGHFATFLCRTYKKQDGKHLETSGAVAVWGGVVYQASQRFKHSTRLETKVCCARSRCLKRAVWDSALR